MYNLSLLNNLNINYIMFVNKNIKVGIIGAGIQGVSNALFLQKKGFKVTIFDRDNPGSPSSILW